MPAKPLTTHGSVDAAACTRPRDRQPGLDLLRALAIVLVVLYHGGIFGFTLPGDVQRFGWVGVDLFFVLSGYLIGGQLLAPLASGKRLDLPRFFGRRALRILPAYLFMLGIYAVLPGWREYPSMPPTWRFLTFVQNLGLHGGTAFSHAWSLCVEAQFYLALPFLLLAVVPRRHGGLVLAGVVILAGVALRAVLAHLNLRDGEMPGRAFQTLIYYPTWTRLDPLVFGVGLAGLEQFRPRWWTWLMDAAPWLWLPGVGVIAFGLWLGEGDLTVGVCAWQFPLIALGMAALLVGAVSPQLPLQRVPVPGAAAVAGGAYSVYLSHKLVMHGVAACCAAFGLPQTTALAHTLNLAAIALVGAGLFWAVERPFLRLRGRVLVKRCADALTTGSSDRKTTTT